MRVVNIVSSVLLITIVLFTVLPAPAESPAPIALHPENSHYFLWRDKPTVLVTSAEHYGAVLNLDFDYVRYLGALQKQGLNLTRTFSGTYVELPHSFGIVNNTLAPVADRYLAPWARSTEPGPGDRGAKYDLTRWNPDYFTRLKNYMSAASNAGVVVEFTLFCTLYEDPLWQISPMNAANNVNGVGACPRQEVFKLMHDDLTEIQVALTRKLVQELQAFDNLIYEVCNEPYVEDCVNQAWQERIIDVIVEEEASLGVRHLISMNIANKKARVESPDPDVAILNFHYASPPDTVGLNYDLNRVIGDNETGFRGKEDFAYRSEAWDFLLAGGALFNHLDYSFTATHPEGDLLDFEAPGGGGPNIRKQISQLKSFVDSFNFLQMEPSSALLSKVSSEVRAQILAEPGSAYALYLRLKKDALAAGLPVEATFTLALEEGHYAVEWLTPVTGQKTTGEAIAHGGGDWQTRTPAFTEDIALSIRRTSAP